MAMAREGLGIEANSYVTNMFFSLGLYVYFIFKICWKSLVSYHQESRRTARDPKKDIPSESSNCEFSVLSPDSNMELNRLLSFQDGIHHSRSYQSEKHSDSKRL
jgi:hypothetical protein